jgi:hypothetical protein
MVPLLDRLPHAHDVAALRGGESPMRIPALELGITPMWLRIHNRGRRGPAKIPS